MRILFLFLSVMLVAVSTVHLCGAGPPGQAHRSPDAPEQSGTVLVQTLDGSHYWAIPNDSVSAFHNLLSSNECGSFAKCSTWRDHLHPSTENGVVPPPQSSGVWLFRTDSSADSSIRVISLISLRECPPTGACPQPGPRVGPLPPQPREPCGPSDRCPEPGPHKLLEEISRGNLYEDRSVVLQGLPLRTAQERLTDGRK